MPPSTTASFTDEQERRFQIRFEEGFNVFTDDDYVSWLEIHHPESLPHSTPEDFTLVGHFSSVSPAVQVAIDSTLPESPVTENTPSTSFQPPATETPRLIRLQSWTNESSDSENSPSTSRQSPPTFSPSTPPPTVSPSTSRQPPATVSPSTSRQPPATVSPSTSRQPPATVSPSTSRQPPATVSPSTSRQPPQSPTSAIKIHKEGEGSRCISKYLTLPQVAASTPKTAPRARLLTSADAMGT